MKKIIMSLLLFSSSTFAFPVPEYMKDAEITVKTKDGKVYHFSGNTHKVVVRTKKSPETEVKQPSQPSYVTVESYTKVDKHKHIVSLLANRSLTDYKHSQVSSGVYRVENRFELAVGLMYQYNFYKDLYLGVQADTHKGLGLNAGLGF